MNKPFMKKVLKWFLLVFLICIAILGGLLAYLFIADRFYNEEKDEFNENNELSISNESPVFYITTEFDQ
ncbi:hypothetical protein LF817_12955 [Halobacillus sp. A1]|uniref:hypothetical protein n=1 Tax=Halobacillus sp. A1 TaxID=2880262 RepID=UPI0020A68A6D|nr:hypothetical protein [Halobacillus sp. A1]MCP3032251.1 hypothetical protein [Halobacillus sp. A1]